MLHPPSLPFLSLAVLLFLLFFVLLSPKSFSSRHVRQLRWSGSRRSAAAPRRRAADHRGKNRSGRPRGQMHRAKESRGEMERHLMFSRWGSQECRSNLQNAHSHTLLHSWRVNTWEICALPNRENEHNRILVSASSANATLYSLINDWCMIFPYSKQSKWEAKFFTVFSAVYYAGPAADG